MLPIMYLMTLFYIKFLASVFFQKRKKNSAPTPNQQVLAMNKSQHAITP